MFNTIHIDETEMDTAIQTLNDSIDNVQQCSEIIISYQEALEEMTSQYLNNIDGIDVMVNETIQLIEAINSAVEAVGSIKEDMVNQDDEGKKIGG